MLVEQHTQAAIDEAKPVSVLSTALYQRCSSRGEADCQDKLLSAIRVRRASGKLCAVRDNL